MINFVLKTRHFVLKTRHFVSQKRNCVFKMLNFAENAKRDMAKSLTAAEGKRGRGSIGCGSISCDEVKARLRRSRDQRDGVARDQCCKFQYKCHLFSVLSIENVERM